MHAIQVDAKKHALEPIGCNNVIKPSTPLFIRIQSQKDFILSISSAQPINKSIQNAEKTAKWKQNLFCIPSSKIIFDILYKTKCHYKLTHQ